VGAKYGLRISEGTENIWIQDKGTYRRTEKTAYEKIQNLFSS
jgi:hypothetical protein